MANDFLVDDLGELIIEDGDFAVGCSDDQHIESILLMVPGEVRDFPLIGFAIQKYQHAPFTGSIIQRMKRDIRLHLESDNAKNIEISFDQTFDVSADYEDYK